MTLKGSSRSTKLQKPVKSPSGPSLAPNQNLRRQGSGSKRGDPDRRDRSKAREPRLPLAGGFKDMNYTPPSKTPEKPPCAYVCVCVLKLKNAHHVCTAVRYREGAYPRAARSFLLLR